MQTSFPPEVVFRHAAELLGWTLLHSLWQGAAVAVVLIVALRLLRRNLAATRHAVCLGALVLMVVAAAGTLWHEARTHRLPVASSLPATKPARTAAGFDAPTLPASQGSDDARDDRKISDDVVPVAVQPSPDVSEQTAASPVPKLAMPWRVRLEHAVPWLTAGWLAGVLLLSLRHLGGWWRVRALRRGGVAARATLRQTFDQLCARYGLNGRAVRLLESVEAGVPMLTGLLRPVVLLPVRAITGLSEAQLEAVLAHELAHLVRRDAWTNLFLLAAETAFFYHPATWWIGRRVREEREHAADDLALRICTDRQVYAGALAQLAEFQQAPAFALAGTGSAGGEGSLLVRVRRILKPSSMSGVSSTPGTWGVALPPALAAAALGLVWLGRVHADDPKVIVVAPGQSIQASIDAAPAGATLRLGPGEWREQLVITKPLRLVGAGWEQTRLSVAEPTYLEMKAASTELEPVRKAIKTPEQKRAYLAERTRRVNHPAIWVHDAGDVQIFGVRIQGLSKMGPKDGTTQSALVCAQRARVALASCGLVGPYGSGLILEDGSEALVKDSLVAALTEEGITVSGAGGEVPLPASRLHLLDSEVRNVYYCGVGLGSGCDNSVIERCRISGTAWHGIRYDNASPTITGNAIYGMDRVGIYVAGKTHGVIRGNLFWRNVMTGMSCMDASSDSIEGNTFVGNQRAGFEISGGAAPLFARNIVADSPVAVSGMANDGKGKDASKPGDPTLKDNLFWDTPKGVQRSGQDQPLPAGTLDIDPKFDDAARANFTLAADSPARRAGIGAADPLSPDSPVPLLAEERSLIPEGDNRNFSEWTAPGDTKTPLVQTERWNKAHQEGWALTADLGPRNRDEAKRQAAKQRVQQALESNDPDQQLIGLSAFQNFSNWGLDGKVLAPRLRELLKSPDASVRAGSVAALSTFGPSAEDLDRALAMIDDPSDEVRDSLPYSLRGLSGSDFTGKAGDGLLRLLDRASQDQRRWLWRVMLDARISPELEKRLVAAARRPDLGEQEEYNIGGALSLHRSRREPTVTLFMERAEKAGNVGEALYALRRGGVEPEQQGRVAAFAAQTLATGETDGQLRETALGFLDQYGNASQAPILRDLLARQPMTDHFRKEVQETAARLEARPATADGATKLTPAEEAHRRDEDRIARMVEANQRAARVRARQDYSVYSQDQLREIERLYQVANTKGLRNEESRASLRQLLEKYDRANRTGCATLYYGQGSEGAERLEYLTRAVEKFSDCYYFNGCQVGGYGRYLLALSLWDDGQKDRAKALIGELRTTYKDATDHHGRPVTELADEADRYFAGHA